MACSTRLKRGTRKASCLPRWLASLVALTLAIGPAAVAAAAQSQSPATPESPVDTLSGWFAPERASSMWSTMLLISALSLAPALLLMTTSFVRISIVLALLRQAIGIQAVPSNQVLSGLALFITAAIMAPVANEIHQQAILPYQAKQLTWEEALERGRVPLHRFMATQIERTGNADDVWLFLDATGLDPTPIVSYDQVPIRILAPAFLLSELKTAFLIGFQIYLPFLVIDLVVAAVVTGMGLVTVPPAVISLPAKLLLFVMVDGWHLIVQSLLQSFAGNP